MDHAVNNPQLLAVLGEHIEQGPWYEATMGLDHEGHSASCTFSVIGSLGTANLHLQVVKFEGTVLSLSLSLSLSLHSSVVVSWLQKVFNARFFSLCETADSIIAMKCHLHIALMCYFVVLFVSFCDGKLSP